MDKVSTSQNTFGVNGNLSLSLFLVVQTDNGREFVNDKDEKESLFQRTLNKLRIQHKRTRPYSPWQNGVVERSRKIDNEMFYSGKRFSSEKELYKAFYRYEKRYNNIAKQVLNFKTPNEIIKDYLKTA